MPCRSTLNQRIERLWREIGEGFGRAWRAFFARLERLHHLDRSNPHHLWLLQVLFKDELQESADEFVRNWNIHEIRGKGRNDKTPDVCQRSAL